MNKSLETEENTTINGENVVKSTDGSSFVEVIESMQSNLANVLSQE